MIPDSKNLTVLIFFLLFIVFTTPVFGQEKQQNQFYNDNYSKIKLNQVHRETGKFAESRFAVEEIANPLQANKETDFDTRYTLKKEENIEDAQKANDFSNNNENFLANDQIGEQHNQFRFLSESSKNIRKTHLSDKTDDFIYENFDWNSAIKQSLIFLGIQHGYALTQPKTRRAFKGKFFKDYVKSVKSLKGWSDGGRFFTNYIAHPMQGSFTGFVYIQNDPKARKQEFGLSGDYWRSRLKAMAWSAAWSTQFEIEPISQASIGNVGLNGKQTWIDIVITPTVGTAMMVTEEVIDRFITQRVERRFSNFYIKIFMRMLLSPTRVFANMINFKPPWYRSRSASINNLPLNGK